MRDHVEAYLSELREIRDSGRAVDETSYYPVLVKLLNEVGRTLKPKVRCILTPRNAGSGIPDAGLFTPEQFQKSAAVDPFPGQLPSRGVVEVKGTGAAIEAVAKSAQVERYCGTYGQVLVTNYREFLLVARDGGDRPELLEGYRLAEGEADFWTSAGHPRKTATHHAGPFVEFLKRVMLHSPSLTSPEEVAWFLASYARDARARIEAVDLPVLSVVRMALEEALGIRFQGEKGEHFFRSTLVQTLFYGIFSAWVLWSKQARGGSFEWRMSAFHLRVPILRKLFHEIADPGQLDQLHLSEVLDWAGAALNRVDREPFFARFQESEAVQYFYEPFLEAFDPELRKELGVWYTPREVVRYMVERVDRVLREELEVRDGLADPSVYVLDPCCGTGAYLVEVVKRIEATLRQRGVGALLADDVKQAALERVFGFEILPAPFVVAHLQLGLLLQGLGAPLSEHKEERAGVFLTNALTGWEPPSEPKQHLLFPEMEQERDAAERIKQRTPILVVLGNPPYNGFAGMAVAEERALTEAYRETKRAPRPQGQGLNDLYVRFFRMAERRIVEQSGKGIVCFISNYSWLDGLSFTGMREHYLDVFDRIWIDDLNGDKYKTGKLTPEGAPDPSVFSTEANAEGIQVGTAVALLARKERHGSAETVGVRQWWGKGKRRDLAESLHTAQEPPYQEVTPPMELGLPFLPAAYGAGYLTWPVLPELLPLNFPGIQPCRDDAVVAIDRSHLSDKLRRYFDPGVGDEEISRLLPAAMETTGTFDAKAVRKYLCGRGFLPRYVVPYTYRPFDSRWLYWEPETNLLDRKRPEYFLQVIDANLWLATAQRHRKDFDPPVISRICCSRHVDERGANLFPLLVKTDGQRNMFQRGELDVGYSDELRPNLSDAARQYLTGLGADLDSIFYHSIAVLYSPAYRDQNAGALRQAWPRVPLPDSGELLLASAELGRRLAALLDPESPVDGVTTGTVRAELRVIGPVSRVDGAQLRLDEGDLEVTAGWGYAGQGGITMPGQGKVVARDYTTVELAALEEGGRDLGVTLAQMRDLLGEGTLDVYLNGSVYWKNVPARVWRYTIGGYQVIKKWLSYRERALLGRPLRKEEVREVTDIARRIAAILLMEPDLDANYRSASEHSYAWPHGR